MSDQPVAKVWTEKVTIVECPECGEVEDLGVDVVVSVGETWECPACGAHAEFGEVLD